MANATLVDSREITDVAHRHLADWPLNRPEHQILYHPISNSQYYLSMRTKPFRRGTNFPYGTTHWDANIHTFSDRTVFYLLQIELVASDRGKGYGSQLYEILEKIAADIGCTEIRQTPSGWTPRGETRKDYLLRRGWIDDGAMQVFKKLPGK